MTDSPTVLVLGAGGRFGSACIQTFANDGWRVIAQRRRSGPMAFTAGIETLVTGDAPLSQLSGLEGVDVVVHAIVRKYMKGTQYFVRFPPIG